jgi:hypothetical protein
MTARLLGYCRKKKKEQIMEILTMNSERMPLVGFEIENPQGRGRVHETQSLFGEYHVAESW